MNWWYWLELTGQSYGKLVLTAQRPQIYYTHHMHGTKHNENWNQGFLTAIRMATTWCHSCRASYSTAGFFEQVCDLVQQALYACCCSWCFFLRCTWCTWYTVVPNRHMPQNIRSLGLSFLSIPIDMCDHSINASSSCLLFHQVQWVGKHLQIRDNNRSCRKGHEVFLFCFVFFFLFFFGCLSDLI